LIVGTPQAAGLAAELLAVGIGLRDSRPRIVVAEVVLGLLTDAGLSATSSQRIVSTTQFHINGG
jgi:hypothetical protein